MKKNSDLVFQLDEINDRPSTVLRIFERIKHAKYVDIGPL